MQRQLQHRQTKVISFSGIDGAGKTTQIRSLCEHLAECGVSFRLVSFWDQVARFTRVRESAGCAMFGGERGVGTPAAPVNRKDKNVQSWLMTCVRLFLYIADAAALRQFINRAQGSGLGVLIFDRFIYDELANLPLENAMVRAYIREMARFVPRPDVSFLLDADPVQARSRKPEYPLEFLESNRRSYFALGDLLGGFTVLAPGTIRDVERKVRDAATRTLSIAPAPWEGVQKLQTSGNGRAPANRSRSRIEGVTL